MLNSMTNTKYNSLYKIKAHSKVFKKIYKQWIVPFQGNVRSKMTQRQCNAGSKYYSQNIHNI